MNEDHTVDLKALGDDFLQDPHPVYAQLRKRGPVHRVLMPEGFPAWLVVGHAEAKALLADSRLSNDWRNAAGLVGTDNQAKPNMLISDPPDHTRLRKLVAREFTPRRIAALRPGIEAVTNELIDAILERPDGQADLVEDFAYPLPASVICRMLGIPLQDQVLFREWSREAVKQSDPARAGAAMGALCEYLGTVIESRRRSPEGDDLLTALVRTTDLGDDQLSPDELLGMAVLLLIAGHETTTGLLSGGLFALLRHPDQLAALRANRTLLDGAVEEMLRWTGPVGTSLHRFTTAPVPVGDIVIPDGGELVLIANTAANRDPAMVKEPEQFDIRRNPAVSHIAFGHGIHFCLGAPLARLEAKIAIPALLDRCPRLALDKGAEPRWYSTVISRGLISVPVVVS